jgi:hypothetical protein
VFSLDRGLLMGANIFVIIKPIKYRYHIFAKSSPPCNN